jgi:pyruvyl transferase EpsO
MTSQQKTAELKRLIEESLRPLITNDYILFDLPYHGNIGDTLIWEGEETFLKSLPHKCISKSSCYTYMQKSHKGIIILLHGEEILAIYGESIRIFA